EWQTGQVLLIAGLLANEHDRHAWRAFAEDGLRGVEVDAATTALLDCVAQIGQIFVWRKEVEGRTGAASFLGHGVTLGTGARGAVTSVRPGTYQRADGPVGRFAVTGHSALPFAVDSPQHCPHKGGTRRCVWFVDSWYSSLAPLRQPAPRISWSFGRRSRHGAPIRSR